MIIDNSTTFNARGGNGDDDDDDGDTEFDAEVRVIVTSIKTVGGRSSVRFGTIPKVCERVQS